VNHSTHLSDLRLDQMLAGELDPPSEAALRAHLVACVPCTHRHGALAAGAAQIRSDPRFAALGPVIRERLVAVDARPERPQARRRSWTTGVFATCAVAAAIIVLVRRPDTAVVAGGATAGLRIKGDLAMDVFVRRAGGAAPVETLLAGDPVHPGDQLRARVRAATRGHFGVFAVDSPTAPAPAVAGYLPAGAELATVEAGTPLLLDGAVELDAAPGRELLLGVLCPSPRKKEAVAADLSTALTATGGDPDRLDWRQAVPGCAVTSLWLRKAAAP
jgi:hypothetical protein